MNAHRSFRRQGLKTMKIFLDDQLETPEGWTAFRNVNEAIIALKVEDVTHLSVSGGLGYYSRAVKGWRSRENGHTVLDWIYDSVKNQGWQPPHISLHKTENEASRSLESIVRAIEELHQSIRITESLGEIADISIGNNASEILNRLQQISGVLTKLADAHFDFSIPAATKYFDSATRLVMDCASHSVPEIRRDSITLLSTSCWEKSYWFSMFKDSNHFHEICDLAIRSLQDKEPSVRCAAIEAVYFLKLHDHEGVLEELLHLTDRSEPFSVRLHAIRHFEMLLTMEFYSRDRAAQLQSKVKCLKFWTSYLRQIIECLSDNVIPSGKDWDRVDVCCGGFCVDALLHSAQCFHTINSMPPQPLSSRFEKSIADLQIDFQKHYRELFSVICGRSNRYHTDFQECVGRKMLAYLMHHREKEGLSFMCDFPATRRERRVWHKVVSRTDKTDELRRPWTHFSRYEDS